MAEWATVAVAIAAIAYTAWVDWRRRRDSVRIDTLNETLREHQIRWHEEYEAAKEKAHVRADHVDDRLYVTNEGAAAAHNVTIEMTDAEGRSSYGPDWTRRLPIKVLDPGQSTWLLYATYAGSRTPIDGIVTWSNPDESQGSSRFIVA